MKFSSNSLVSLMVCVAGALLQSTGLAEPQPSTLPVVAAPSAASLSIQIPAPPAIAAKAYLLVDHNSGRVIAESNADLRLEPASLTKIMTSYVTFHELAEGKLHLDEPVLISERAWRTEGSRMFADVNKPVPVEALLKGMIIQSGNDASVALAERIAGDESVFAQLMNQHAEHLGLKNTHFKNSMGLPDPEHYTSARDLATLTRALIRDYPEYYKWHSIKEYLYNGIKQTNRNRLLWRDPTVDGVKTGHTEGAGYCLVASALRDGMRLIAIVLGTKSDQERANANQALLNYGFRFYETRPVYKGRDKLSTTRVYKAETSEVPVGLGSDLYVTVPRGQYPNVKANMELDRAITAPLNVGQRVGIVKLTLNGELIGQHDLVVLQDVKAGNWVSQLVDSVLLLFK